jgi:hypothetical protein
MGDEDKQAKPRFEPPPWEVEAFEAFAAKRAERQAAERAAAEALRAATSAAAVPEVRTGDTAAEPVDAEVAPDEVKPEQAVEPDGMVVQMMLQQLARDESSDRRSTAIITWVAAGVTVVLGLAMLIGGISIASRAAGQSTALIGSAVLVLLGLAFIGMAVWVWFSTSRVRGR